MSNTQGDTAQCNTGMVFLLQCFCKLLAALPWPAALRLGRGAGWLAGSVFRYRRGTAFAALKTSFPDRPPSALNDILNGMYAHLGVTMVEMARVSVRGLDDMRGRVRVHATDAVEELRGPKGGLILMGHIGNWELMGCLRPYFPRPMNVVVKPLRSPALATYVERNRATMGLRLLPFKRSYRDCLRVLKQDEFVAIILDQNTKRTAGVFVDFFGRTACASAGLAILSAQTGLPVYPSYGVRREDGTHDLYLLPPLPPPPDRKPETIQAATQAYTRILENIIREHPEQWIWIHKRWRTQPKEPA